MTIDLSLNMCLGDGTPCYFPPAVMAYVWSEKGLVKAFFDAKNELALVKPDAVVLHGGTGDLLANLTACVLGVRKLLPNARIMVGVGIDGGVKAWRDGKHSGDAIITRLAAVARLCALLNVEAVFWNGEAGWADQKSDAKTGDEIEAFAREVRKAVTRAAPKQVHALSSYGRLGYHAEVRALMRGMVRNDADGHYAAFTGQSYAAQKGEVIPGVLPSILAKDARSQEATERAGWIPDDVGDLVHPDVHTDVDRIPSVQSYKTAQKDLLRALVEYPHILAWSLPMLGEDGRTDASGLAVMQAAMRLRREVGAGAGAIVRWQTMVGLKADNDVGPKTLASLGVTP